MIKLVAFRIAWLVPVLLGASVLVFVLLQLTPGDPTVALLGPLAPETAREALRQKMGLEDPIYVQYLRWLGLTLRGDLGLSIEMQAPVLNIVVERFKNTLILAGVAGLLAVVGGVWAGVVSAVKRNSFLDRVVLTLSILGISIPPFLLGIVVLWAFAVNLSWFPTGQMYSLVGGGGLADLLRHLVLPVLVAVVVPMGIIARVSRAAMLEVLHEKFITGLRSKGLSERSVSYKHAFKNALPSIVTVSGLQVGYLLLGWTVFVEIIFNWPGIGLQTFRAILARDLPLILGIVLASTTAFVFINVVVDITCAIVNPRVKLG